MTWISPYPLLHHVLRLVFSEALWSLSVIAGDRPQVALTFDDGVHPQFTPPLLEVLAAEGVTANFFLLGQQVAAYPELTAQLWQQGHWLGLHGYRHRSFPRFTATELRLELIKTQTLLAQVTGQTPQRFMALRPPNGIMTPRVMTWLKAWGFRVVMWSVVSEDWRSPGIDTVVRRSLEQVHPGAIIVLHDGMIGGQDVAAITAKLIPSLRDRGYDFTSLGLALPPPRALGGQDSAQG
ncbi:MAG: polysaccharide deacetylase family protein [Oscillatoriales cyanobacterium SM2_2_1]|nr:polysaccharide deacetylase family protein [Oscillatoriales cyanobacterium SM2_2_1]